MKVIGFCGYAKSGKDTAAQVLIEEGWIRVAFADALKDDLFWLMQRHETGVSRDWFIRNKEPLRPLLVEYGRAMRSVNPGHWTDRVRFRLAAAAAAGDRCVITDVRYVNEAAMIREMGGMVIRVERVGVAPANAEEASSMQGFEPDAVLPNLGTIEHLHEAVLQYVGEGSTSCPT